MEGGEKQKTGAHAPTSNKVRYLAELCQGAEVSHTRCPLRRHLTELSPDIYSYARCLRTLKEFGSNRQTLQIRRLVEHKIKSLSEGL